MKRLLILFLFCQVLSSAQNNLISNYSFENNSVTPPCQNSPTPYLDFLPPFNSVTQGDLLSYWAQIDAWDIPELGGDDNCWGTASPDCLCDNGFARTGIFYGRHVNREYIIQHLSETIFQGEKFYYEFYVKGFNGGNFVNVGIKLFENKPYQCKYHKLRPNPNDEPQIKVSNVPKDGLWHKVSGFINASDNYSWISLGTYDGTSGDEAFWDDLKIYKLDANQCPLNWTFENTVFENEHKIFQASDKIIAGNNVDAETINGPVIVNSNSNIIFRAGNQIILEAGFSTQDGSYFETVIEPCGSLCPSNPPPINDIVICDANSLEIGNPSAETGLFYSWYPATYLDNPNSPNPVFTPPAGSGEIEYTVTITNICGAFYLGGFPPNWEQFLTEDVTVIYNTNPDPNSSVTITSSQTSDYYFNFDFTVGAETEEYCIEFSEQGTGNVVYSDCFETSSASCCNYTFNYDMISEFNKDNFSVCKDYTIKVHARNYCTTNIATDQFDWNRNENFALTYVPNVVSIANPDEGYYVNGLNDEFCIQGTGIDHWDFSVTHPQYVNQYFAKYDGHYDNNPQCVWDGRAGTNQNENLSFPVGTSAQHLDTYYFILTVTGCNSNSQTETGDVAIFWDMPPQMQEHIFGADGTSTELQESTSTVESTAFSNLDKLKLFPNPTNDLLHISCPKNLVMNSVQLYDNTGRIILSSVVSLSEIDLSSFSNGIYFLEINTDQGIFREKIIKQ